MTVIEEQDAAWDEAPTGWACWRDRMVHLGLSLPIDRQEAKRAAWKLGSALERAHLQDTGRRGKLIRRCKTHGGGTQGHVHYPQAWWPRMDEIVRNMLESPQGLLPFER